MAGGGVVVHVVYNLILAVQKHCTERTEEVPPPSLFQVQDVRWLVPELPQDQLETVSFPC